MTRLLVALSLVFVPVALVAAELPLTLVHEGRLLDASDTPVDGPGFDFAFRVMDRDAASGGEREIWKGSCTSPVSHGHYAVALGGDCGTGLTSAAFPPGEARWLEVKVGETVLVPRLRIGVVPIAAIAQSALTLEGVSRAGLDAAYDARYVRAQGGSTAAQEGSIAITGTVSAAAFSGEGAGLTGVNATRFAGATREELEVEFAGRFVQAREAGAAAQPGNIHVTGAIAGASFAGSGATLTDVDAARLGGLSIGDLDTRYLRASGGASGGNLSVSGTITATRFEGDGSGLTAIPAANLTGTIGRASLPTSVAFLDAANTFTQANTFSGGLQVSGNAVFSSPIRVAGTGSEACTSANPGAIRFQNSVFEGCDGRTWMRLSPLNGVTRASAVPSCAALKQSIPGSPDGLYWITLTGAPADAFQVFCDMTNDGGGWTLVMKTSSQNYADALWTGSADLAAPACLSTSDANDGACKIGAAYAGLGFTSIRGTQAGTSYRAIMPALSGRASLLAHFTGAQVTDANVGPFLTTVLGGANTATCASVYSGWNYSNPSRPGGNQLMRMVYDYPGCGGYGIGANAGFACGGSSSQASGNWICGSQTQFKIWFWVR